MNIKGYILALIHKYIFAQVKEYTLINKNQVITDQINILTLTQQEAFNEGDYNTIIDISQAILLLVDNLDKELIT